MNKETPKDTEYPNIDLSEENKKDEPLSPHTTQIRTNIYNTINDVSRILVISLVISFILYITKPSYHSHTQTVTNKMSQHLVGDTEGDGFVWSLIDKGVEKYSEGKLKKYGWRVDDRILGTVGYIKYKGEWIIVSIGILGKVFVRDFS